MARKNGDGESISANRPPAIDPDDAPGLTNDFFDRVQIVKDGKIVQRGRPRLGGAAKVNIAMRLDPDVVAAYRSDGPGWQTRLNADLRRIKKLGKVMKG